MTLGISMLTKRLNGLLPINGGSCFMLHVRLHVVFNVMVSADKIYY